MENCLNKRRENMKTDIEIAQEAKMLHIREVAEKLGIAEASMQMTWSFTASTKQNFLRNFWKKYKLVPTEN